MVAPTMPWLRDSNNKDDSSFSLFRQRPDKPQATLGILCFEVAKTMSRLIALYNSLSDDGFSTLRNGALRSRGVRYLTSDNGFYLLSLACAEKLEDLDSAAFAVSSLGHRCSSPTARRFDFAYEDLKQGSVNRDWTDFKLNSKQGNIKIFRKMEKYVSATTRLHSGLEALAEMESSQRKLQALKLELESKIVTSNGNSIGQRIMAQRKQVKRCRETSLWNATFDKSVTLMAQTVFVIYLRICKLFGPYVSFLPNFARSTLGFVYSSKTKPKYEYGSGPLSGSSIPPPTPPRFYSQELSSNTWGANFQTRRKKDDNEETNQRLMMQSAPPSTVGGSGLALRFADIIVLAERYLHFATNVDDGARAAMYEMLPDNLKMAVKRKLGRRWNREEGKDATEAKGCQAELAEGWRDAAEEILDWLAPMAHDTVKWQTERQLEKQITQDLDGTTTTSSESTVLLVQTLHFSNLEKTEAAIVEVLVALSCVYRYEGHRFRRGDNYVR